MRTDDLAELDIYCHSLPHFYEKMLSFWAEWYFAFAEDVSYFTRSADTWPPVLAVSRLPASSVFPFPTCLFGVVVCRLALCCCCVAFVRLDMFFLFCSVLKFFPYIQKNFILVWLLSVSSPRTCCWVCVSVPVRVCCGGVLLCARLRL